MSYRDKTRFVISNYCAKFEYMYPPKNEKGIHVTRSKTDSKHALTFQNKVITITETSVVIYTQYRKSLRQM